MREVAVTKGDKVSAQIKFGFAVNGYGVGDLVKVVDEVSEKEIDPIINKEYEVVYDIAADLKKVASATNLSARPRTSNWACARFWRQEISKASPRRSKTCAVWCNCLASRRNA